MAGTFEGGRRTAPHSHEVAPSSLRAALEQTGELDEPVKDPDAKWGLLPAFLSLRGLVQQHV